MTDRWRNRRAMAWLSVLAGLLFPLLAFHVDAATLGVLAGPFYLFVASVAGAYIGFATVDDKWQAKSGEQANV